jgi:hypothetical protein
MNGFLCTLHHDDFVGDDLQWYTAWYLKWLCTCLIHHSFNDELEPTNPRNKKCLLTRSLLLYLGNAAARAKISDPRVPQNLGSQEADFQNQLQVSKIESVANETGNQQQLCNMLLDLTKEVRESRKETSETRTSFNAVVLENASHKGTISTMDSEMNDMKHRLQIAERKVSQLRTPPPPQKRSSPVMGSPHLHHASSPPLLTAD